jgi:hypothetical protein
MLSEDLKNIASQLNGYAKTGCEFTPAAIVSLQAAIAACSDQAAMLEAGVVPQPDPMFPDFRGDNIVPITDARRRRETARMIEAFMALPPKGGA